MSDVWHKILMWLGLSDHTTTRVSRLSTRHIDPDLEDEPEPVPLRPNIRKLQRTEPGRPIVQPVPSPLSSLHVIEPKSFNDAPKIADRLKRGEPVIMNFQNSGSELSQRLMDFVAGSTYSLAGRVQRVGEKVILITPASVEVSDEDRRRLQENGFFFSSSRGQSARRVERGDTGNDRDRRLFSLD